MQFTISAGIRTGSNNAKDHLVPVVFRVRSTDTNVDIKVSSKLKIERQYWDQSRQGYKKNVKSVPLASQSEFNSKVSQVLQRLTEEFHPDISAKEIKATINSIASPELAILENTTRVCDKPLSDVIDLYLQYAEIGTETVKLFLTLQAVIKRFDSYSIDILHSYHHPSKLKDFDAERVELFREYLRNEHKIAQENPDSYKDVRIEQRGENTVIKIMKKLRTLENWCVERGYISSNPFYTVTIGTEVYGTPIYISVAERNQLYNHDLSKRPGLATQRDIFVFQCLTGCRFSDLMSLTPDNVIEGYLEYIPEKGRRHSGRTVSVPLGPAAKEIIERYKGRKELLPFISIQGYNDAIKEAFELAGLTRMVTIRDPKTGKETQERLCDIASSHMARRTFAGNIYKSVKDPTLVSALTGHSERSQAFTRYRDIDNDIKEEIIKNIE